MTTERMTEPPAGALSVEEATANVIALFRRYTWSTQPMPAEKLAAIIARAAAPPRAVRDSGDAGTIDAMETALLQAAAWFDEYGQIHDRKGDEQKKARNLARADYCRDATARVCPPDEGAQEPFAYVWGENEDVLAWDEPSDPDEPWAPLYRAARVRPESGGEGAPEARERQELLCEVCNRDYPVWYAPSELWNRFMRGGYIGNCDEYSFLCPTCFGNIAYQRGERGILVLTTEAAIEAALSNGIQQSGGEDPPQGVSVLEARAPTGDAGNLCTTESRIEGASGDADPSQGQDVRQRAGAFPRGQTMTGEEVRALLCAMAHGELAAVIRSAVVDGGVRELALRELRRREGHPDLQEPHV